MIRARNITKSFDGKKVVDDVSFDVDKGQLVALLGPSGGGKSTVLRILSGLEAPDSGVVHLEGKDASMLMPSERGLGFVFQHYALFRHMTVRENIGFGLEVRKRSKKEIATRVDELLSLIQLDGLGGRYPHQLSGGQRQRVALARSLAPAPAMLLLDEPFGALDAKVRLELRSWLRRLQREQGITAVFVTHDQEEALELADRVVIIQGGKVEQEGSPEDVYDRPKTPFVASFLGSANVLTGTVARGRIAMGGLGLDATPSPESSVRDGADVTAFVRHHQVSILHPDSAPVSDRQIESGHFARAKVDRIARVGWVARLELTLKDGSTLKAELTRERLAEMGIAEGDDIMVSLKDAAVFTEDYSI